VYDSPVFLKATLVKAALSLTETIRQRADPGLSFSRRGRPSSLHSVFRKQRGGDVLLLRKSPFAPTNQFLFLSLIPLLLLLCVSPGLSQKPQQENPSLPNYDVHTETKIKGLIDEVNLLSVGTRKDFTEVIIKNGDDKAHIYLCPKPYQEEMGISFSKGDQIAVTGSKVKQEASDVILARELVKGTDTLLFRDDKGKPVWDARTGK
jgi:hypothetical protein